MIGFGYRDGGFGYLSLLLNPAFKAVSSSIIPSSWAIKVNVPDLGIDALNGALAGVTACLTSLSDNGGRGEFGSMTVSSLVSIVG